MAKGAFPFPRFGGAAAAVPPPPPPPPEPAGFPNFQCAGPAHLWPTCSSRWTRSRAAASVSATPVPSSASVPRSVGCDSATSSSSDMKAAATAVSPSPSVDNWRRSAASRAASAASRGSGSPPRSALASKASAPKSAVPSASLSSSYPPPAAASPSESSSSLAAVASSGSASSVQVTPVRSDPTMPQSSAHTCFSESCLGTSAASGASGTRTGGGAPTAGAAAHVPDESNESAQPGRTARLMRRSPFAPPSSNLADVRWKSGSTSKDISSFLRSSDAGFASRLLLGGLARRGFRASLVPGPSGAPASATESVSSAPSATSPPFARFSPPMSL
mmetsp:Transcript_15102/g.48551  ORF Transcript_15102/g.48551 Transcript_15102/m.48551 type:complete len:332 (-) Transcript_15102:484-1479(-)